MITDAPCNFPDRTTPDAILDDAASILQAADRDRYLTAMLAAREDRPGLMALFAFNHELACVPGKVSDTILGQMRYQSWRDAVITARRGGHPGLPIAIPVSGVGFDPYLIDALIEGREAAFMRTDAPANFDELADWADTTGGVLGALTAGYLMRGGPANDAALTIARHAGTAYALADMARAISFSRDDHPGFVPTTFSVPSTQARGQMAIRVIADLARSRIRAARKAASSSPTRFPARLFPAFVAATMAEQQMGELRRLAHAPARAHPERQGRGAMATLALGWRRWRNRF